MFKKNTVNTNYKKYKRLKKYRKRKTKKDNSNKIWLVVYVLVFLAYYIKLLFFD